MGKVQCPNCGSFATQSMGPVFLGFMFLMSTGLLVWIPIIGWVMAPFMLLASIGCFISAPFVKQIGHRCNTCKYSWKEEKVKNQ